MANFNTHLSIALAVSTSLATAGMMVGLYGFFDMVVLSVVGMIGGLLPDIDLDNSRITRLAFNVASTFGAIFLLFLYHQKTTLNPTDMLVYWGVLFFFLRFGVLAAFSHFTRHRGMVHSVPYMAVLSLLFVYLSYHTLGFSDGFSWLLGVFLWFGSLVHLLLDEVYSVNVYGLKVKKSFGSAFKFFEQKKPAQYGVLYAILLALWVFSPPKTVLLKTLLPILSQI